MIHSHEIIIFQISIPLGWVFKGDHISSQIEVLDTAPHTAMPKRRVCVDLTADSDSETHEDLSDMQPAMECQDRWIRRVAGAMIDAYRHLHHQLGTHSHFPAVTRRLENWLSGGKNLVRSSSTQVPASTSRRHSRRPLVDVVSVVEWAHVRIASDHVFTHFTPALPKMGATRRLHTLLPALHRKPTPRYELVYNNKAEMACKWWWPSHGL